MLYLVSILTSLSLELIAVGYMVEASALISEGQFFAEIKRHLPISTNIGREFWTLWSRGDHLNIRSSCQRGDTGSRPVGHPEVADSSNELHAFFALVNVATTRIHLAVSFFFFCGAFHFSASKMREFS
ncbi:hypothetical protein RRG08_030016 [Elysia crispata]|uniref:Secreted protein n=1 Tax=Elysia crispata TaxID=231223 RepID=A0AAE0XZ34_9GAST|nr:hypothetical protein RRG08_030016 [Elysia crispata]